MLGERFAELLFAELYGIGPVPEHPSLAARTTTRQSGNDYLLAAGAGSDFLQSIHVLLADGNWHAVAARACATDVVIDLPEATPCLCTMPGRIGR